MTYKLDYDELWATVWLTVNFSMNYLPFKPRPKFEFSFVAPRSFLTEVVGEVDKISSKFILYDHVRNSHDQSVLQTKFDADHSYGLKG